MEYRGEKRKGIRSTCRDCQERYIGCHDHCEKYLQAQAEWLDFKSKTKKAKKLHKEFDSFRINALRQ